MQLTLQTYIEESFNKNLDSIAVQYGSLSISYSVLYDLVEDKTELLCTYNVQKGDQVGFIYRDPLNILVALLASLRTGVVFIPLDETLPSNRLTGMMQSIDLKYIHSEESKLKPEIADFIRRNNITTITNRGIEKREEPLTLPSYSPEDKVYIYFTSGSTGTPNAIIGKNKSLLHYLLWEKELLNVDETFTFSQLIYASFDAYLRDTLLPLVCGGKIAIPANIKTKSSEVKLRKFLNINDIQVVHCVPSVFKLISSRVKRQKDYCGMKYILLSGERIIPADLSGWYSCFGNRISLINLYGATETTMTKTHYQIKPDDIKRERIPIGKAMKGAAILILNVNLKPCDILAIGEIYIRTPYGTYGYFNGELNKFKYIQNPFTNNPNDLLYKTGDLGRYLPDGNIDLIGRIDRQVKINGVRVELEELENVLLKNREVTDAVVTWSANELRAFIVCNCRRDNQQSFISGLIDLLENELPRNIIPYNIDIVEHIPRLPNGKTDFSRMSQIARGNDNIVLPRNTLEMQLSELWSEVFDKEENIGIRTGFFALGGNSLNLLTLRNKIIRKFNKEIALKDLYRNSTIETQARILVDTIHGQNQIKPSEKRKYYPLTEQQNRLFILNELNPESRAYNITATIIIEGEISIPEIESALGKLAENQEILRSSFHIVNGVPVQKIRNKVPFSITIVTSTPKNLNHKIKNAILPFDLSKAPLLRCSLIHFGSNKYVLVTDMHHIISDATSIGLFNRQLIKLLNKQDIPNNKIAYKDYAVRQLKSGTLGAQKNYWLQKLQHVKKVELPYDFLRSPQKTFEGNRYHFSLSENLTGKLKDISSSENTTLFSVVLSLFYILLSKLSNEKNITIGTPVEGRRWPVLENVIGMFANTLVLKSEIDGFLSFQEYLKINKEILIQDFENQDFTFESLIDSLEQQRDLSRNPVFDIMFTFHDSGTSQDLLNILAKENIKIRPYRLQNNTSKFDLTLIAVNGEKNIDFTFEYSTDLFREKTIERFADFYLNILTEVTAQPSIRIKDIEIITEKEKARILNEFNDTTTDYSKCISIIELFERQVLKTSELTAIIFEKKELNYQQLNILSDRLASQILSIGVKPESIIGIFIPRSVEMIVGILAVLKCGCAYLPLDTEYPDERLEFMLKDSGVKLLLTNDSFIRHTIYNQVIGLNCIDVCIDSLMCCDDEVPRLKVQRSTESLTYLIYTSGSTGKPKGIMINDWNVINFVKAISEIIEFTEGNTLLCITTISFDIFVLELFIPLLHGLKIVLANSIEQTDPIAINKLIEDYEIQMLQFTPSRLKMLIDSCDNGSSLSKVSTIMVGGEEFPQALFDELKKLYKGKIYNMFGPTETTVWSTVKNLTNKDKITIGTPISNTSIRILDKYEKIQPINVVGELHIGGEGVSKGYWKNDELTKDKFIHWDYNGERIYKTGDIAKWNSEGEIEFLGRVDDQIKLRGYRIELGEIESQLMDFDKLKTVVVQIKMFHNEKVLCAYYMSDVEITNEELRSFLSSRLPAYMIPAIYVRLKEISYTPNGKIDRRALPDPSYNKNYKLAQPKTELEFKVLSIFSKILNLDSKKIGVDSNFFEMGGNSLKAILLVSNILKELNIKVILTNIFEYPTVGELTKFISSQRNKFIYKRLRKTEQKEYFKLSAAQKQIYAIHLLNNKSTAYNVPLIIEMEGTVDRYQFELSIKKLIARHESLRTIFPIINNTPIQRIQEDVDFKLEYLTADISQTNTLIKNSIKHFDLSKSPLFRITLVKISNNKHLLIFDIHHIITDEISQNILFQDLVALYQGKELKPLVLQYKDHSEYLNTKYKLEESKKHLSYWLNRFRDQPRLLQLPYDGEVKTSNKGQSYHFELDKNCAGNVKTYAMENNVTLFMFMVSVYSVLLSYICNQNDVIIGTPNAGRDREETEKIVGVFVKMLALRFMVKQEYTFSQYLDKVKKSVLGAFENSDFLLDELLKQVYPKSQNSIFNTVMVLVNHELKINLQKGLKVSQYNQFDSIIAKYPLSLYVLDYGDSIKFNVIYKEGLFNREKIIRFSEYFTQIINTVVSNKGIKISDIDFNDHFQEVQSDVTFDIEF